MKFSKTFFTIVFLGVQLAYADNHHDDHHDHDNHHPAPPQPTPKEVNRVTLNGVTYINKVGANTTLVVRFHYLTGSLLLVA